MRATLGAVRGFSLRLFGAGVASRSDRDRMDSAELTRAQLLAALADCGAQLERLERILSRVKQEEDRRGAP